jgi:hypothetical protein
MTGRHRLLSAPAGRRGLLEVTVLVPVAALVSVGSMWTDARHLRNYLLQFAALSVALWAVDRVVRLSAALWWACVALIGANLAMGSIYVAGDEIYNLELGAHVMRLDHPVHLVSAALMTLVCAEAIERVGDGSDLDRPLVVAMAALAALGLGAVKEMSDAFTGLDTDPTEVVWSTRWDLVFNTIGAAAAATALLTRRARRRRQAKAEMTPSPKPARVSGGAKSANQM